MYLHFQDAEPKAVHPDIRCRVTTKATAIRAYTDTRAPVSRHTIELVLIIIIAPALASGQRHAEYVGHEPAHTP